MRGSNKPGMPAYVCVPEDYAIGSTTPDGGDPKDRPLVPGDLLASVYRVLGIHHDQFLPDRQNRPIRLIEQGQPIAELH